MLLTLIKVLATNDLDIIVANIELPPIDIDVMLYEAQENGEVEIDKEKNTIKALKEPEYLYSEPKLYGQIMKLVEHYDKQEANITKSRLEGVVLNPGGFGYPRHDFVCTLFCIEENAKVKKYEIKVPKSKKRPAHTFEFYTLLDHQEYGAKAVNAFIDSFDKK